MCLKLSFLIDSEQTVFFFDLKNYIYPDLYDLRFVKYLWLIRGLFEIIETTLWLYIFFSKWRFFVKFGIVIKQQALTNIWTSNNEKYSWFCSHQHKDVNGLGTRRKYKLGK